MKVFLLALFVAAAVAAPAPLEEENGEPVELIVNGIAEGEPLELGDVLELKLKEHADGQIVSSSNLLHPFTAEGLAEQAAAEQEAAPEEPILDDETPEVVDIGPLPVELPPAVLPETGPESIVLPEPALPELAPELPVLPEYNPPELDLIPAEVLPVPAPQIPGEVFNDGVVQVSVNAAEPNVLSTIQSWFNMVLNYFNDGVQTTHQIV